MAEIAVLLQDLLHALHRRGICNQLAQAMQQGFRFKSFEYYADRLRQYTYDLYSDGNDMAFIDRMTAMIAEQLGRAWREGMGWILLDPQQDFTEAMAEDLELFISNEYEYLLGFAEAILEARESDAAEDRMNASLDGLLSRADLWANRYLDVANYVTEHYGDRIKLEWVLGGTKQHCDTCLALSGTIAFDYEWEEAGIYPQQPPNPLLGCGGWRCDCQLVPTSARRTPHAIDRLYSITMGG